MYSVDEITEAVIKEKSLSDVERLFCGDSRTTVNPKSATLFKSNFS